MSRVIEQIPENPTQSAPVDIPDGTWDRDSINARVAAQDAAIKKAYADSER